jgi:hypothetical protein
MVSGARDDGGARRVLADSCGEVAENNNNNKVSHAKTKTKTKMY